MKILFNALFLIFILNFLQSVLISKDYDIRKTILEGFKNKPINEIFKVYHFLYQKKYNLNSEEGIRRYKIFKTNLKVIEEINSQNLSYKLGINDFADLSDEEFTQIYAKPIPVDEIDSHLQNFLNSRSKSNFDQTIDSDNEKLSKAFKNQNLNQQLKINWNDHMNPPVQQGNCGSCWAFSTVGAIEGNYNIKFGESPSFSQQELVDCDFENKGCLSGQPYKALDYIVDNGLAYLNEYPYKSGLTNSRGECLSSEMSRNMIVESYDHCKYFQCSSTQYFSMLQKGPIIVYVDSDGGSESFKIFKLYSSGILENLPCNSVTHAVVLIGIDYDEKGQYLIARNSWGQQWGEKGNFRIRRNQVDYTCFMESFAALPYVKQTFNPVPPPPSLGCLKLYSQPFLNGEVKEICENTPTFEDFPYFNGFVLGKFISIKLFYTSTKCRGRYFILERSYGNFNAENGLIQLVNNLKSAIVNESKPPECCIWVYEFDCLSGEKLEICNDVADLKLLNFSDRISSFKKGVGVKGIIIYLKPNYGGSYATLINDYYGMFGVWMDNNIESIKILKN